MFQTITDTPDPSYRRNNVYYTVQLAEATRRQGEIPAAIAAALQAIPAVAAMRSVRTRRLLTKLRSDLGTYAPSLPEAQEFTDAYDKENAR